MLTINSIVAKNMKTITLIMVAVILFFSTVIQIGSMQQSAQQSAEQMFSQVEQLLEENSAELEQVQREYESMCLNDARTVAYILEYNPGALDDVDELKKIAAGVEVDEIHIFDKNGVIIAGTHPEYFGFSFDSGEQIGFFKPLLSDKSLELVQDITPNTAESKLVQYSALWSEDGEFIVQIGMSPSNVLRATQKNELSYIFSLLRIGIDYRLYAVDPNTDEVIGATVDADVGQNIAKIGFRKEHLASDSTFYTQVDRVMSYCLSRRIGENSLIWAASLSDFFQSILYTNLVLLAGLVLIALILVYAVSDTMNRTVAGPIKQINENLRAIQEGDLTTKVDIQDSREFLELSAHINNMVTSLLQSSEKLEMSEQIQCQKEELEHQREQLEAALERAEAANRTKSEFLFNMSHDIRTPMNAIIGFTNLALESGDPKAQREYLENIDISSKQMLDLVNHILELSRIENHKIVIEEDLVDVSEAYRKLGTVVDRDLRKKHLTYKVNLDIQHPYLYLDTTHYSQIFLNIVNNAIKFTPNGGTITATFRELPGESEGVCIVETVIEDNGIGMSADFLAHACESFARERNSTASGVQGTGLGLAIVKNLVDLMRGTIAIESQQGEGTKVTIRLPQRIGEAPKSKPADGQTDQTLFEGRRILMAEDIDINAMIAAKLLTGKGCTVERARDGVECVDMLLKAENGYYDLVLMDIQMPNMNGYQAAQSIRAFEDPEKASIPILALTANAFKEDCDKAAEVGMNGHIAKPLDPAKMFQMIAEVFRGNL